MAEERPEASYEHVVAVLPSDIDQQGHVNNVVYVRWVMDIATEHWNRLSTEEIRAQVAWWVVRHEVDYLAPAMPGDEVRVHTRVGLREGVTYERLTDLFRVADGKPLAKSRTLWVPVDPATGKPRRLPREVAALVSVNR